MSKTMNVVEASDLSKVYEKREVVSHLTLHLEKGESYCLLGPNGAGKTTTINMLLGFTRPTSGTAKINGINTAKSAAEAMQSVSYVPEVVTLYPNLSGFENLKYFATLKNPKALDKDRLYAVLEEVGLAESAYHQRAATYSKGMRQKISIALAFYNASSLLILDEPTSGLDPASASDFLKLLQKAHQKGQTVLMVTHDIFRAKMVAQRIGIMSDGKLVREIFSKDVSPEAIEKIYLEFINAN